MPKFAKQIDDGLAEAHTEEISPGLFLAEGRSRRDTLASFRGGERRCRPIFVQGIGLSEASAFRRCAAEAVERTSLMLRPEIRFHRASFRDLEGQAIHPQDILLDETPFDEQTIFPWTEAIHEAGGKSIWVLAELCYFGYDAVLPVADSSGCAAGFRFEDAAHRAVLEAAERDAVGIWWRRRALRPEVSPGVMEQEVRAVVDRYHRDRGREWWILDVSSDSLAVVCVAVSADATGGRLALGAAADVEIGKAAARAALEMTVTAHTGDRDSPREWWSGATLETEPHLAPSDVSSGRLPEATRPDVYLKDHTVAGNIPVVRAIIPGWCTWDRYRQSKRLVTVPERAGWRCLSPPDCPNRRPWPA